MSLDLPAPFTETKPELYASLREQAQALLAGERNAIANAANLAALISHSLPSLNWSGFYLWDGKELVLGPFQGKIACVRIALGRGVCGNAAQRRETIVVPDVLAFPDHIVCDVTSRSEIVVPLFNGERLLGVLDLDSPVANRFDAEDATGLEALARLWIEGSDHR